MSDDYQHMTKEELIRELEETREQRDFFRAILDGIDETIELYSHEGVLLFHNQALLRHSGLKEEDIPNFNPADYCEPEDLAKLLQAGEELWNGPVGGVRKVHQRVRDVYGNPVIIDFSLVNQNAHPLFGMLAVGRVISHGEEFEVTWKDVDEALSAVFNGVHDAIFVHDWEGRIVRVNRPALKMFGMELLPPTLSVRADHFYGPAGQDCQMEEIWSQVLGGQSAVREWKTKRHDDGSLFDVEVVFSRVTLQGEDLVLVTVRDVSERKRAEERLRAALREKEALLREVHHRVKNNLAVISSLLRLQARRIDNQELASLFAEADFRIRCIGMVHEKLYQSKSIGHLSVREYLNSLIDHLLDVYGKTRKLPRVRREIDDISLDPDRALPLGFITSELFSNALKHAFPEKKEGEITISLHRSTNGIVSYRLVVRDNGVGLPMPVDLEHLNSVGLRLVRTFAEQLGGHVQLRSEGGARVEVRFSGSTVT